MNNLITPKTLEEVRLAFAKQLDTATKCDGDYLNGKTLGTAVEDYIKYNKENSRDVTMDDAIVYLESKVKEYAEHKGEAQLFFLREVTDEENSTEGEKRLMVQCVKIWESELSDLIGVPYSNPHAGGTMPRFIQHNILGQRPFWPKL